MINKKDPLSIEYYKEFIKEFREMKNGKIKKRKKQIAFFNFVDGGEEKISSFVNSFIQEHDLELIDVKLSTTCNFDPIVEKFIDTVNIIVIYETE